MRSWFRLGLLGLLLAGIAGLSAILTMQFAVHRTVVRVPDLQGLPMAEATSRAAALGMETAVSRKLYSTVLPEGRVLAQMPAPGTEVRRGWTLAVAESLGPRRIAIPMVVGKSERDAVLLLRARGLDLGATVHLPDNREAVGTVVAQDPEAGAEGAEQPSVSLLVAAPAPAQEKAWVMPDVVGKPYAEAAALLERAGLHVSAGAGTPGLGAVTAQTPEAGFRVEAGARVELRSAP